MRYFCRFALRFFSFAAVLVLFSCTAGTENNGGIPAGWKTGQTGGGMARIYNPRVYPVENPVTGNYPQGLFKYPFRAGMRTIENEVFTQTLEWIPEVPKTFAANTKYTAKLILEPTGAKGTFKGTPQSEVLGLPETGVERVAAEIIDESLVLYIVFEETAAQKAAPELLFEDTFEGAALDYDKWETCPDWDRHGHSSWRMDMVSVRDGNLVIGFRKDPELGARLNGDYSQAARASWIRTGGIRTRRKTWAGGGFTVLWDGTYGYYEARIKYPKIEGIWGAFWLMSPNMNDEPSYQGRDATEIDIVEFAGAGRGNFNAALHWDGYGSNHKGMNSGTLRSPDIYDGEFHVFALDWSPSEYVFYVDGQAVWRTDGSNGNGRICENPLYMKLTVESNYGDRAWAGTVAADFTEGEMLVDYVRVWNQPK